MRQGMYIFFFLESSHLTGTEWIYDYLGKAIKNGVHNNVTYYDDQKKNTSLNKNVNLFLDSNFSKVWKPGGAGDLMRAEKLEGASVVQ